VKRRKRRKSSRSGGWFRAAGSVVKAAGSWSLRALPWAVGIGMIAGLLIGVRDVLYADPHLIVKEIRVQPADSLVASQRAMLESKLINRSLLTVRLNSIAQEIEKNPAVLKARVSRRFPSVIQIDIQNREPAAFVKFAPGGKAGLVSEDGMILDVTAEPNGSLPLIEVYALAPRVPRLGDSFRQRGFGEAVEFVRLFRQHPLSQRESLTRMSLDPLGNVAVTLGAGPEMRLGTKPAGKLAVMDRMLLLLEGKDRSQIEYMDLQFDNVIVKRKGENRWK
jgi:cell division septal protein FtsQ